MARLIATINQIKSLQAELDAKALATHNHDLDYADISHSHNDLYNTKLEITDLLADKQDALVSGTNIKTVNGTSLLGSGDIEITGGVLASHTHNISDIIGGSSSSSYEGDFTKIVGYLKPNRNLSNFNTFGTWSIASTTPVENFTYKDNSKWGQVRKLLIRTGTAINNTLTISSNSNSNVSNTLTRFTSDRLAFTCKFGVGVVETTDTECFVGISRDSVSSTSLWSGTWAGTTKAQTYGVAWRSTDSNLHIFYRGGVGNIENWIDLGSNFPIPNLTNFNGYELVMTKTDNTDNISVTVININTGNTTSQVITPTNQMGTLDNLHVGIPLVFIRTKIAVLKDLGVGDLYLYQWNE